jgi:UDP-glucose 4-epimerase
VNQLEGRVILVTGANGFIGTHLVERLSTVAEVKLLLLSRQDRQSTQANLVWIKGELGQLTPGYWRAMGISHIDYVFHLGAFTPKISSEANRIDRVVDDNILGTRALLQSLPGRPEKLVFSSTLDVYEHLNNGEVLTESSKVCPSTLYGASKLFCESLVSAWATESGCDRAILRYGHIYGPGEEQYGKLIPVVVRNLLANQAPVVYGDGSALRDYLYVGDAVEATIRAALAEGNIEPINVVRGESITLKEIVQLLIRLVGNDLCINFLSDKPNGNSLQFDNALMLKSLGHWSMTSLAEGLAAEVDAFRGNNKCTVITF